MKNSGFIKNDGDTRHQWTHNLMTPKEKQAFEKELKQNEELQEDVNFDQSLKTVFEFKEAFDLQSYLDELEEELPTAELTKETEPIPNKPLIPIFWESYKKFIITGIAAIGITTGIILMLPPETLQKENTTKETPIVEIPKYLTLQEKHNYVIDFGEEDQILNAGEEYFDKGDYESALEYFTKDEELILYLQSPEYVTSIQYYKSVALLRLNRTEEALNILESLSVEGEIIEPYIIWYRALAYAKMDDIENAEPLFEKLLEYDLFKEDANLSLSQLKHKPIQ